MSNLGDAFAALKNIALLHERVANLRTDVEGMNRNVAGLRDYVVSVDTRLSRLEGFLDGAAAASGKQRRLPEIEE
ncbi:MAG: hypothetical protein K2P79_10295 [Sphingomonas sp.]|nr:hypothetical protein [Sphingomonas sp.]